MFRSVWFPLVFAVGCGGPQGPGGSDVVHQDVAPVADVPLGPVTPPSKDQARVFREATNGFALDLWRQMGTDGGNLVLSPASISVAMGMTWGGAAGRTAEQMAAVMGFGEGFQAAAGAVLSTWDVPEREAYRLAVANRLFGRPGWPWRDDFLALTAQTYRAPFEETDFAGAPEPSRLRINDWVEKRTQGRIKDLIPPGGIDASTAMVLTNAVYFLADWASKFDVNDTWDQPFHAAAGEVRVPTMHQTANFSYAGTDGVQLLEMPYAGGELSMLIVLPEARDGLADVEARLTVEQLQSWEDEMGRCLVDVALPKFRVEPEQSINLKGLLTTMGMPDAFDPSEADFSGMAERIPGMNLYITGVFHKAFVAVDEEGTEAAAATAVVAGIESAAPIRETEAFTADHPFLFFIRDDVSGAILFMGRVADPS